MEFPSEKGICKMSQINNDWLEALKGEFKKPYYNELYNKVIEEYKNKNNLPSRRRYFFSVSSDAFKGRESCYIRSGPIPQ